MALCKSARLATVGAVGWVRRALRAAGRLRRGAALRREEGGSRRRPELCRPLHRPKRWWSATLCQEEGGGRSSGCGHPELRRSLHRPKRQ
uniref:Uncharacterized protein n=1 Tax=Oryza meridionalis TaxID=40149 RepID=A0A0E0F497_9ORYZ